MRIRFHLASKMAALTVHGYSLIWFPRVRTSVARRSRSVSLDETPHSELQILACQPQRPKTIVKERKTSRQRKEFTFFEGWDSRSLHALQKIGKTKSCSIAQPIGRSQVENDLLQIRVGLGYHEQS